MPIALRNFRYCHLANIQKLAAKMFDRTRAGLRAVYGVYFLGTRQVWAPGGGELKEIGLAAAPRDLAGFIELGNTILQSERIASLIQAKE